MLKWLYRVSKAKHGNGTGLKYPRPKKGGFVWVYAVNPTKEEIAKLAKDFKLKTKKFEIYVKEERSTRYSVRPLSFAIVDYYLDKKEIKKTKVLYIVGRHYIIIVTPSLIEPINTVFERVREELLHLPEFGIPRIVYEIVDEDTEENYDILELIEARTIELEKSVTESRDLKKVMSEVVRLKRKLSNMSKVFWSSAKMLYGMKKSLIPFGFTGDELGLIDDVHDTFIHQIEVASAQKEMLTDTITIYQATLSNRLAELSNKINVSVKRLTWVMLLFTGIATVLTIPNTIATVFGIPEWPISGAQWRFIALTLLIGTAIPLFWFYNYWKKIAKETEWEHV